VKLKILNKNWGKPKNKKEKKTKTNNHSKKYG
jgi:hypothetical protein